MKKVKLATVLTILVSVVYVIYLSVLSYLDKLPVQKTLTIWEPSWQIPLPFEVSYWWYILLAPITLLWYTYCINQNEFTGQEPHGGSLKISCKHEAKTVVFCMNAVSMFFFVGPCVLSAFIDPIASGFNGPLSVGITAMMMALGMYILIGMGAEFLKTILDFETSYSWESNTTEKYMVLSAQYIKLGFIKTLPMVIGLTLGFICRLTVESISKFFKIFLMTINSENRLTENKY